VGTDTIASSTQHSAWVDGHDDLVAQFFASGSNLSGWTVYDPLGNPASSSGTQASVGYQSEYTDAATGQVNMAARWYSPGQGQFTSADTVDNSTLPNVDNANPYAYADASPLTGTDPSGHEAVCEDSCPAGIAEGGGGADGGGDGGDTMQSDGDSSDSSEADSEGDSSDDLNTDYFRLLDEQEYKAWEAEMNDGGGKGSSSESGDSSGDSGEGNVKTDIRKPGLTQEEDVKASRMGKITDRGTLNNLQRIGTNPVTNRSAGGVSNIGTAAAGGVALIGTALATGLGHLTGGGNAGTSTTTNSGDSCANGGTGWVEQLPADSSNGNRATGAIACLTPSSLKQGSGSNTRIPGYGWARAFITANGGNSTQQLNACHLIPRQFGGSGGANNFAPCGRTANQYPIGTPQYPYGRNMYSFEDATKRELTSGAADSILYSVTPEYDGSRVIPFAFEMSAVGWDATGDVVYDDAIPVWNVAWLGGQWVDLGRQSSAVGGNMVPAPTS
jgi:RHS repeat-associated protein